MYLEEVVKLVTKEAQEQIENIHEMQGNAPLTWAQGDALGDVRSSLRECLNVLTEYIESLPEKEAIDWLFERVSDGNLIIEGLLYPLV